MYLDGNLNSNQWDVYLPADLHDVTVEFVSRPVGELEWSRHAAIDNLEELAKTDFWTASSSRVTLTPGPPAATAWTGAPSATGSSVCGGDDVLKGLAAALIEGGNGNGSPEISAALE